MILGCYVKVQKRPTNIVVEKLKRLKNTRVNNSESSKTNHQNKKRLMLFLYLYSHCLDRQYFQFENVI